MKLIYLLLAILLASCQHAPTENPARRLANEVVVENQETLGKPGAPEQVDKTASNDVIILDHKYFKITYDKSHLLAKKVEYYLNKEDLQVEVGVRTNKFRPDPLLKGMKLPAIQKKDILGKDYDKGHLAPADDFKRSQVAVDETFVMTNIAPQRPRLNQQAWLRVEALVHSWACGEGKILVISGPVLSSGLPKLSSGMSIPDKFYKAVYDLTEPVKSICFVYNQQDDLKVTPEDRDMSVVDCEKIVGFNLGPPELEKTENEYDIKKWRAAKCR